MNCGGYKKMWRNLYKLSDHQLLQTRRITYGVTVTKATCHFYAMIRTVRIQCYISYHCQFKRTEWLRNLAPYQYWKAS